MVSDTLHFPKHEQCLYAAGYCEENIWQLCSDFFKVPEGVLKSFFVVFCSNDSKTVPCWCQRSGQNEEGMIVWDYHVFLIYYKPQQSTLVFDLDTTLEFPCDFKIYFDKAIRNDDHFKPEFQRMFRTVPAEDYLTSFSSDRSHMIDQETGQWLSQPPSWPPIFNGHESNLDKFWSMKPEPLLDDSISSELLSTKQFRDKFWPQNVQSVNDINL